MKQGCHNERRVCNTKRPQAGSGNGKRFENPVRQSSEIGAEGYRDWRRVCSRKSTEGDGNGGEYRVSAPQTMATGDCDCRR